MLIIFKIASHLLQNSSLLSVPSFPTQSLILLRVYWGLMWFFLKLSAFLTPRFPDLSPTLVPLSCKWCRSLGCQVCQFTPISVGWYCDPFRFSHALLLVSVFVSHPEASSKGSHGLISFFNSLHVMACDNPLLAGYLSTVRYFLCFIRYIKMF